MSIVPSIRTDEKSISHAITQFISVYGIVDLLARCGGTKAKGFSRSSVVSRLPLPRTPITASL